jgi:hypothetical protein
MLPAISASWHGTARTVATALRLVLNRTSFRHASTQLSLAVHQEKRKRLNETLGYIQRVNRKSDGQNFDMTKYIYDIILGRYDTFCPRTRGGNRNALQDRVGARMPVPYLSIRNGKS